MDDLLNTDGELEGSLERLERIVSEEQHLAAARRRMAGDQPVQQAANEQGEQGPQGAAQEAEPSGELIGALPAASQAVLNRKAAAATALSEQELAERALANFAAQEGIALETPPVASSGSSVVPAPAEPNEKRRSMG